MNICLLTSTYFPLVGGLEIAVHNLAVALTSLGHNVYVVTPRSNKQKVIDEYPYKVIRIGFKGYGRLKLTTISALLTLAYVVKRYRIDVIHVHNVFRAGYWSRLFRKYSPNVPVVGTPHGDDVQTVPEIGWGIRLNRESDLLVRKNLDSFTMVTAISGPIFQTLKDIGVDENKIARIPNGIWYEKYQVNVDKEQIRRCLGIPTESTVVISIGRNHPVKGYRYGIEALAALRRRGKHLSYLIVGRNMNGIVQEAADLGVADCLFTTGEVSSDETVQLLAASDIFISTSILESFGLTTLEAMSVGLPCIVTECSGILDLVCPKAGLMVKKADTDSLVKALIELMERPELHRNMGCRAKEEAQKYNWPVVAKSYEKLYSRAIETEKSR